LYCKINGRRSRHAATASVPAAASDDHRQNSADDSDVHSDQKSISRKTHG
jgi:hypothetical protein